jgi:hypothetical protein
MINEYEIEGLLFKQIEKPKHHLMTKIINVFHDYYRINIYTQIEEEGLLKQKIAKSYMTTFRNNELTIIPETDGLKKKW